MKTRLRYAPYCWMSMTNNITGAGYVKSVGNKVAKVKPGDAVLLSFAFCTQCHNCKFGAPGYCESFNEIRTRVLKRFRSAGFFLDSLASLGWLG